MNILLIAPTEAEIAPFIKLWDNKPLKQVNGIYEAIGYSLYVCITGIGGVATAYNLTRQLAIKKYDLVIQAGIAGSYTKTFSIGDIVCIDSECFADLGADDNGSFLNIFALGLADADGYPFSDGKVLLPESKYIPIDLPLVSGITVNTATGNQEMINSIQERYFGSTIESMEGAAFFYVCAKERVPFIQIRAISNYVEPRDKSRWDIPLAIKNLNNWLAAWCGLNS